MKCNRLILLVLVLTTLISCNWKERPWHGGGCNEYICGSKYKPASSQRFQWSEGFAKHHGLKTSSVLTVVEILDGVEVEENLARLNLTAEEFQALTLGKSTDPQLLEKLSNALGENPYRIERAYQDLW